MPRAYSRPYVGVEGAAGSRTVFRSAREPTATTHPQFMYCIGPFRTKRGAKYMAAYGRGTDWTRAQAERYARL